jgi:hypothetical protein
MAERVRNVIRPNPAAKAAMAGVEAPSMAVLSETEMNRLRDIVANREQQVAMEQVDRRAHLKEVSDARVANWPNTIEAQRMKKERGRKARFEEEEERRKVIDQQETELQEAKKQAAIRKANMLLYEQNDKIKTFSSKLFLASVLDEREQQLHLKQQKKAAQKAIEERFTLQQAEELKRAQEEEEKKLEEAERRAVALKQAQLQQLADIRVRKIARRDDNVNEGAAIKHRAMQAVDEEVRAEVDRKLGQKARAKELITANEEQKRLREAKLERERVEEEKILKFASVKEEQMLERKRRVDDKHSAKLDRRQRLIDQQAEMLAELQAATEEREMKAMRDFEKERREREEREANVRAERQMEIDRSRRMQLDRRSTRKEREANEKGHMQDVWRQHAERMIDEELEERMDQRRTAERNQHVVLLQAHEKRMQALKEKEQDFIEGLRQQEAAKQEQEDYEKYVNSVMHDYVSRGRNSDLVQTAARRTKTLKSA